MLAPSDSLPQDLAAAHAMILAQRAMLAEARSEAKVRALEIERLKLMLAKARREKFGQSSERGKQLIEQLELAISDLEETQAEEETKAEIAAPAAAKEKRARAPRGPRKLPDNLPVERIVEPAPCACGKCGGVRLRKLGILASKFFLHQPLNRQSATYAREGVEIDVSTLADWVGASVATLDPIVQAIRTHVFRGERIHADDTTVPVLAKLMTNTGRIWTYVRDDRPFGGKVPPAAIFYYSRTRAGEYPRAHLAGWAGIMQADAYAGYNELYEARRRPAPIQEAACWAHGRRKFFELAKLAKAPIACEAVRRIDELFEIEREINGRAPEQRLAVRQKRSKPLVAALEAWLREQRDRISAKSEIAKAINYSLNRWAAFTRFLDDGRICLSNNAAERAVRGVAIGRGNWTFCGSDAGGHRAAAVYTLVETCKLNDVDPQAWLAYVLAKLPDHPAKRIDELLPWNWKASQQAIAEAA